MGKRSDYIICYLDILGYKELVKDKRNIKKVEESVKHIFDKMELLHNPPEKEKCAIIAKTIKVNVYSDTIIFKMPLTNIRHREAKTAMETVCILFFLSTVAIFYVSLVNKLGYFMRGGIEVGQYYEKYVNGNLFVFSQGLVNAYLLEKKAGKIRVLIGDSVIKRMYQKSEKWLTSLCKNQILIDEDGLRCLNLYGELIKLSTSEAEIVLKGMAAKIKLHLKNNRTNKDIIEKYLYFVDYHNHQVNKIFNLPDLAINPKDGMIPKN